MIPVKGRIYGQNNEDVRWRVRVRVQNTTWMQASEIILYSNTQLELVSMEMIPYAQQLSKSL